MFQEKMRVWYKCFQKKSESDMKAFHKKYESDVNVSKSESETANTVQIRLPICNTNFA